MDPADIRLVHLAEFLGIECQALALDGPAQEHLGSLEGSSFWGNCCLVVNPSVIRKWTEGRLPSGLAQLLRSSFPYVLLYNPHADAFDASLIAKLSGGRFRGVQPIGRSVSYSVSAESRDVCGAFAGITFGPANPANDQVFQAGPTALEARNLISIGGDPFMAALQYEGSKILFLGGSDVIELSAEVNEPLAGYFSRFLPFAMALRYVFGEESWKPSEGYACVIVDDPLLRGNYGFLNYSALLKMMEEYNFHTTVGFIPHNCRRSSPEIARMFRENSARFSLCVHGNDHTGAEFATIDKALLHSMLQIAEHRMRIHHEKTGISCERVMVFPQGKFSAEAMIVLQSMSFECAVNTGPYARQSTSRLTIGELAQPAVLRYSGFPLFLRNRSAAVTRQDIAFNLFFGKPVFLVEHHDAFRDPTTLVEAVSRINSVAPEICWTNVGEATANSLWRRRTANDEHQIRAYCRTARITNHADLPARFAVEWTRVTDEPTAKTVLSDGESTSLFDVDERRVKVVFELAPQTSRKLSLSYADNLSTLAGPGVGRTVRAFVRRRLSEIRDNYLSSNPLVLTFVNTIQRSLSREDSHLVAESRAPGRTYLV
jgi:hypothetical protein